MKMNMLMRISTAVAIATSAATTHAADCPDALNVEVRQLHSSKTHNLCEFYRPNIPLLVVNTASHCGYTKQFAGLEALYQKHKASGLVILGFPSNSFKQEEQSEEGTARVCYQNYGVTFPMFEHVNVKGNDAHPLFRHLAQQSEEPQWNFNKYLLSNGHVKHYDAQTAPDDARLEKDITSGL